MILIWVIYFKYPKCLYYLIKDLLLSSLNIIVIISNIIFFKLNFIFNTKTSINISYFYIVKNIIYFI